MMYGLAIFLVLVIVASFWGTLVLGLGVGRTLAGALALAASFAIVALLTAVTGDDEDLGRVTTKGVARSRREGHEDAR